MSVDELSATVAKPARAGSRQRASVAQLTWLRMGLEQPGGKLPLFDSHGQRIDVRTIRACMAHGWAEPWVVNPIKPDWEVCKLTEAGRALVARD